MKKTTISIFVVAALFAISANAVTVIKRDGTVYQTEQERKQSPSNYNYSNGQKVYEPYKLKKQKQPPSSTHVQPNAHGGYSWIEPGNSDSDDILERLPEVHSIEPDGHGGYYIN